MSSSHDRLQNITPPTTNRTNTASKLQNFKIKHLELSNLKLKNDENFRNVQEILSKKNELKSINNFVPPIGMNIVTYPSENLFKMYLDGQISGSKLVGLQLRQGRVANDRIIDEQFQELQQEKITQFKQWENVEQFKKVFQEVKFMSYSSPLDKLDWLTNIQENQQGLEINYQNETGDNTVQMTSRNKLKRQMIDYLQISPKTDRITGPTNEILLSRPGSFTAHQPKIIRRDSQIIKSDRFLRKCERYQGEPLTEEDRALLMKLNKTDDDLWAIIKHFQKKKWFFELLYKTPTKPSFPDISDEDPVLSQLKNLIKQKINKKEQQKALKPKDMLLAQIQGKIERVQEDTKRKIENHDLLNSNNRKYFDVEAPVHTQLRDLQVVQSRPWENDHVHHKGNNIKEIIAKFKGMKVEFTHKLRESADKYFKQSKVSEEKQTVSAVNSPKNLSPQLLKKQQQRSGSFGELLQPLYDFNFKTGVTDAEVQLLQHKKNTMRQLNQRKNLIIPEFKVIKRNSEKILSKDFSFQEHGISQNDSYPSVTELQLHNLYRDSRQLQKEAYKLLKKKNNEPQVMQKKVRSVTKLGNIQQQILDVTQNKLERQSIHK